MDERENVGTKLEASEDREGLIYRYSRKERLERAPESLRKIYQERASGKKKGFFALLMANKGLLLLFGTIVFFIVFAYAIPLFTRLADSQGVESSLAGRSARLEALWKEGMAFGTLSLGEPEREAEPEELRLRLSTDGKSFVERSFVLSGRKAQEILRFSLPAAAPGVMECLAEAGGRVLALSARMEEGE